MNSKFKVFKYKSNKVDKFDDSISIEEPLEIILKYLNKDTWIEKTISVNDSDVIETIKIEVYACFTEPPDEISEDYVLINVKDNFKNEGKSIYKGWMISSSPEVTPLEHPIYDLWLLGCSNDKTS